MGLEELAREHALRNRAQYGRADAGAVVAKVMREPEAKQDPKAALARVQKVVEEVNALSASALQAEVAKLAPREKPPQPQERKIELEGAEPGKVVTRFLPEPNFILHIGHAKAAWLSRAAADQYQGKCILRFDDTNPDAERAEYVEQIREGTAWLGLTFDGEGYTSDKIPKLYQYAEQLLKQGDAYVCHCVKADLSHNRSQGKACAHRARSNEENFELWRKMLAREFKEGEVIVRLKGDMQSLNTVMRDPTLFRIVEAEHYRQGKRYLVWPTYDFEVSISDSLDGVTHALRSKEYELRDELYYVILDKLGLRKPRVYDFARLEIKGTLLSKRRLKPLMDGGQVKGWDDPRLPTLAGLRKRGILPEAIKSFVLSFGLSKVESEPSWEALLVENRKRLDSLAPRYHFVKDPVRLVVKNAPPELTEVKISLHPEKKELGERTVKVTNEFHLAKADADALSVGEVFRLKDLYNVKLVSKEDVMHTWLLKGEFVSRELTPDTRKLHWVPGQAGGYAAASVLVPQELFVDDQFNPKSLRTDRGYAESAVKSLPEGTVLQFLRYGFVRLDDPKEQVYVHSC